MGNASETCEMSLQTQLAGAVLAGLACMRAGEPACAPASPFYTPHSQRGLRAPSQPRPKTTSTEDWAFGWPAPAHTPTPAHLALQLLLQAAQHRVALVERSGYAPEDDVGSGSGVRIGPALRRDSLWGPGGPALGHAELLAQLLGQAARLVGVPVDSKAETRLCFEGLQVTRGTELSLLAT